MPDPGPHTSCALFKGADPAQTYLCEGEGNAATGASHASPGAAGSPLLITPLYKPTLPMRLGTHWWGEERRKVTCTHFPPQPASCEADSTPGWPRRGHGMFEMPMQGILGSGVHRRVGRG